MGRRIGLIVMAIAALSGSAHAVTTQFSPTRDNTLFQQASGSLSDGAGEAFYVGRTAQATTSLQIRRGLIYFNIGSLPANATVTNASLRLMAENRSFNGDRFTTLHRVLQDWGQGTSNSAGAGTTAAANDATWLYRFYNPITPTSSPAWTTAGGSFAAANSAGATCPNLGGPFPFSGATGSLLVSDLQSWINN